MNNTVLIYADGACKGNNSAGNSNGGWGAYLQYNEVTKEIWGGERETTNNRMELTAVIKALESLKRPCNVRLCCDSKYVLDGSKTWMANWKRNNWKTSDKKPVKNEDLWRRLDSLLNIHEIDFVWVKGHNGDPLNELADKLANRGYYELIAG